MEEHTTIFMSKLYGNLTSNKCVEYIGHQPQLDAVDESILLLRKYIFKYECDKMNFICVVFRDDASEQDILEYMLKHDNRWYDMIRPNKPVREFYDVDLKRTQVPKDTFADDDAIVDNIVQKILNTRNNLFHRTVNPKDLIVLTSHSSEKISVHIIVKTSVFKSYEYIRDASKHIYADLQNDDAPYFNIDTSVYSKNRIFRMQGSTKFDQDRVLKIFKPDVYSYSGRLQSSVVYPLVDMSEEEFKRYECEWNMCEDIHRQHTSISKSTINDCSSSIEEFLKEYPYFELVGTRLNRKDNITRECLCDPNDSHSKENMYLFKKIDGVYARCFCGKGQAILIEKFHGKINVTPKKSKYSTHSRFRMTDEEYAHILETHDRVIDCRQTGSGKTTNLMNYIRNKRGNNSRFTSIITTPRIAIDDAYKRDYGDDSVLDIKSYRQDKFDHTDNLSVVINSLYKTTQTIGKASSEKQVGDCVLHTEAVFHNFDMIAFDEIGTILSQMEMKDLQYDISTFFDILCYAKCPMPLLDANVTDEQIEFILDLYKRENGSVNYAVITQDFELEFEKPKIYLTEGKIQEFVKLLFTHDFKQKKAIIVSNLSIDRTNAYLQWIHTKNPFNYVYINSETHDNIVMTDEALGAYDCIVYSPKLAEGVSFSSSMYKDYIGYGWITNKSTNVYTANQMFRRFRALPEYHACIEIKYHQPKFSSEHEMYAHMCEHMEEYKEITKQRVQLLTPKGQRYHTFLPVKDDFYRLHVMNFLKSEMSKHNDNFMREFQQLCANNQFDLYYDNVQMIPLNEDEFNELKTCRGVVKRVKCQAIADAEPINSVKFESLKNIATPEVSAQCEKFIIMESACPQISPTLYNYYNTPEFYEQWLNKTNLRKLRRIRKLIHIGRNVSGGEITQVSITDDNINRLVERYSEHNFGLQKEILYSDVLEHIKLDKLAKAIGFDSLISFKPAIVEHYNAFLINTPSRMTKSFFNELKTVFRWNIYEKITVEAPDGALIEQDNPIAKTYESIQNHPERLLKWVNYLFNNTIGTSIVSDGINAYMKCKLNVVMTPYDIPDEKGLVKPIKRVTSNDSKAPPAFIEHTAMDEDIHKYTQMFFSSEDWCPVCQRQLKCKISDKRHLNSAEHQRSLGNEPKKKELKFKCGKGCGSIFRRQANLEKHNCEKNSTKCDKCGYPARDNYNLKKHIERNHP